MTTLKIAYKPPPLINSPWIIRIQGSKWKSPKSKVWITTKRLWKSLLSFLVNTYMGWSHGLIGIWPRLRKVRACFINFMQWNFVANTWICFGIIGRTVLLERHYLQTSVRMILCQLNVAVTITLCFQPLCLSIFFWFNVIFVFTEVIFINMGK